MISRRSFLAALAVLAGAPGRSSRAAGSDPTFLVFGDWGTRGLPDQRKVAVQMAKTAEAIGARFVISTGDNFYPKGVQSVEDAKWVTNFEDVYNASALKLPWYITLGNHDHDGNARAQVDYTSSRWRLPANYYKHTELLADGSRADFFYLDTTPIIDGVRSFRQRYRDSVEDKQLVWLERELAASDAAWKLVIGHHPLYSGGDYSGGGRHESTHALIASLKPLFERFGVQAYLNGHCHCLEHVVVGKIHYLTSGAGSIPRPANAIEGTRFVLGDRPGFMTARITSTVMDVEFIDYKGTSLYQARIPSVLTS
jgi:tartrate-resistant acid phosphatase type 5